MPPTRPRPRCRRRGAAGRRLQRRPRGGFGNKDYRDSLLWDLRSVPRAAGLSSGGCGGAVGGTTLFGVCSGAIQPGQAGRQPLLWKSMLGHFEPRAPNRCPEAHCDPPWSLTDCTLSLPELRASLSDLCTAFREFSRLNPAEAPPGVSAVPSKTARRCAPLPLLHQVGCVWRTQHEARPCRCGPPLKF
jgi:hypothetical protein